MYSTSKPTLTYDGQRWHESIIEIYSSGDGREHDWCIANGACLKGRDNQNSNMAGDVLRKLSPKLEFL
jgi:hypothetical protein